MLGTNYCRHIGQIQVRGKRRFQLGSRYGSLIQPRDIIQQGRNEGALRSRMIESRFRCDKATLMPEWASVVPPDSSCDKTNEK